MTPKRPTPALMDDAMDEILLLLPPDDPECLVRASVVCKPWRRLFTNPTFLRRFREFHRTPPLLGFLRNEPVPDIDRFVPTTAASPFSQSPSAFDCRSWWALDCRHGRVLIRSFGPTNLIVWDPITGNQPRLPLPAHPHFYCAGAVLCAVRGCDHLNCHGGPFLVVFVGTDDEDDVTWASVYSSETGQWCAPTSVEVDSNVEMVPSLLTGGTLYFMCEYGMSILGYDMGRHELSVIELPLELDGVMTVEDGGLGLAGVDEDYNLHLWSWQAGADGDAGWTQRRVIELETMLPVGVPAASLEVIGIAEGTDIIFLNTAVGVFKIEHNSGRVTKVGVSEPCRAIVPYMSFYTPDLSRNRIGQIVEPAEPSEDAVIHPLT